MNLCPKCGFPRIKNGKRKLKYRGLVQNYICKRCGCEARDSDFKGFTYPRKVIEFAVYLYSEGVPLKRIVYLISKVFGILIKSTTTIWYWCQWFLFACSFVLDKASDILHADETKIKTNKKGKYFWFWACKDPKTKLIVGWHVSDNRSEYEAKKFFWKVKEHLPNSVLKWPKKIRTDGMPSYYPAIMKVFSRNIEHDKFRSFESHSNNEIENFFRCKNRFPKFRNKKSAENFIESWINKRNYEILNPIKFLIKISERFVIRLSYGY